MTHGLYYSGHTFAVQLLFFLSFFPFIYQGARWIFFLFFIRVQNMGGETKNKMLALVIEVAKNM